MSPPSTTLVVTISASPDQSTSSGDTTCTWRLMGRSLPRGLAEVFGLGPGVVGTTDVQERLLGQLVEITVEELFEALDGLVDRGGDTGHAGEDLGDVHR